MKILAKLAGFCALCAVTTTAVVVVMGDEKTRTRVINASKTIQGATQEVVSAVVEGLSVLCKKEGPDADERNRAWVDEQWQEIGI